MLHNKKRRVCFPSYRKSSFIVYIHSQKAQRIHETEKTSVLINHEHRGINQNKEYEVVVL